MRHLLMIILACLLTACLTNQDSYYTQTAQSWRGTHVSRLIAKWGKPFEEITATHGNKLYVYRMSSRSTMNDTHSPRIGITNPARPVTVVTDTPNAGRHQNLDGYCFITFTTNTHDIIVSTNVQGTDCVSRGELR